MKSEILVDTNLLLYSVDEKSQFHLKTQTLLYASDYDLSTTSKNLAEFLVAVTRDNPPIELSAKTCFWSLLGGQKQKAEALASAHEHYI